MKYLYYLLYAILCVGCTEITTSSTEKSEKIKLNKQIEPVQENELNFMDSLPVWEQEKSYNTWLFHKYNREYHKVLNEKEFNALHLEKVYAQYDSSCTYYAYKQINISNQFKTIIVGKTKQNQASIHIATYTPQYEILDNKLVHLYEQGRKLQASFLINSELYIEESEAYISTKYGFNEKGLFKKSEQPVTFRSYRYHNFNGYLRNMPKRFVKRKKGILIKDAEGNPIRTAPFGAPLYIVDYEKDHKNHLDGELLQDGKVAKVVIDTKVVTKGKNFYIPVSNIGYVDTEGLFQLNPNYDYDDEETEELGSYYFLSVGLSEDYEVKVDPREIFEISKIAMNDYKEQIVKTSTDPSSLKTVKKDNTTLLAFKDGSTLMLKDTIYLNSEYTPSKNYYASTHQDFENAYIVLKTMIFTQDKYYVLSMENGDTLHQFSGFPYLSPQKTHRVSVSSGDECIQETYLHVSFLEDNTYKNYASMAVSSWSYPYIRDEDRSSIDVFELYWLNEKEFILKVKNPEDCDLGEEIDIYYLKYKIKL